MLHPIDFFDLGARDHPGGLVASGAGGERTYAEVWAASNRLARGLLAEGIGVEAPIALLSPNCSDALVAWLGALRAGCAWCNVNLRAGVEANVDILRRGRCRVLFVHSSVADQAPAFQEAIPELQLVLCLDSDETDFPWVQTWAAGQDEGRLDHPIPPDAIGVQGSTGGTTGEPKITRSPNSFLGMSMLAWRTCWSFEAPPVNLAVAPITHAAGLVTLAHLVYGGETVMMAAPDVEQVLALIEERRVTTLFLPPTLIYLLLAHPRLDETDTSSLRYLISAAAPVAPEKLAEAVERLGPIACQAYGQTEAGFPLTWMAPHEVAAAVAGGGRRELLASCGRPTVMCTALEAMGDDGTILGPGGTGELVLRGPGVLREYLDDPDASAEVRAGGWHHTGDIGHRDADGYVFITDRKRDMITSGGFNIFPFEIEQVLLAHPAVQDAAVIGVPDPKWGEAVKACVQLKAGRAVSEDDLIAACKAALGSMKAPKSVDLLADLPRSPVGKVLKRELRAPYWAGRERQVN
jgi:acyl-CoA synthetase (AMP-forming)/AMP-acid ligase II